MADVSDILGVELMEPGTRRGEWGEEFNEIIQRLEEAIAGEVTIQTTGGETVLTTTDIVQNEARMSSVRIIGELEEEATIVIPPRMKATAFFNETTGAFSVSVRTENGVPRIVPQGTGAVLRSREDGAVVFQTPAIDITTGTIAPGFLDEGSIAGSALEDEAITEAKLAEDAVSEDKIQDGAVTGGKIADGSVTEGKIDPGAVTESKIAVNAVTNAKLAQMAAGTLKANLAGAAAAPSDVPVANITSFLPETSAGAKGVLALPGTPTGLFLRDDGTFAAPVASGSFLVPVRAATTANITLENEQTIDDVALTAGDRVLVKNQTSKAQNGIYIVVDSGAWTRASDFDEDTEAVPGTSVLVLEGNTQAGNTYTLQAEGPVEIGATDLEWIQTGAAVIPAGSVGTPQLADGAVTTAKIGNLQITAGKLASEAVTTDKIANEAVTEAKLEDGAVTEDKLGAEAVTADKIADGAVTEAKLGFPFSLPSCLALTNCPVEVIDYPELAGAVSVGSGGVIAAWELDVVDFAGFLAVKMRSVKTGGAGSYQIQISMNEGANWFTLFGGLNVSTSDRETIGAVLRSSPTEAVIIGHSHSGDNLPTPYYFQNAGPIARVYLLDQVLNYRHRMPATPGTKPQLRIIAAGGSITGTILSVQTRHFISNS